MKTTPAMMLNLKILGVLALFISKAGAISLQTPTRPTEFPLVIDDYHESGAVIAWGTNIAGVMNVPVGLTNVVQVAANNSHAVALKSDSTVVAWGDNGDGESAVPSGLTNVVQVAAGFYHSVALKSNGTVVAWGATNNNYGQTIIPADLTNVVQISAGALHTVALKRDGTVVAWGAKNKFVGIYQGETNVPAGLTNVIQVEAGDYNTVALKSDGTVVGWGYAGYTGPSGISVPVGLTDVIQIAAGGTHTLGLKKDGTVIAWGDDVAGEIDVPAGLTNVVQVAADDFYSLALRGDGTLVAWGDNYYGESTVPAGLTNVVQVAAGGVFALALQLLPNQSIASFSPISDKTYPVPAFKVEIPKATSGLPVKLSLISGPAKVSGDKLIIFGAGVVVLAANQGGNAKFIAASQVITSFTVNPGKQTISKFISIPAHIHEGKPFDITRPRASSGLPVSITVKSGPASITGNKITFTGIGTVVLAANQGGNANYNPAPEVTTSFYVQ